MSLPGQGKAGHGLVRVWHGDERRDPSGVDALNDGVPGIGRARLDDVWMRVTGGVRWQADAAWIDDQLAG